MQLLMDRQLCHYNLHKKNTIVAKHKPPDVILCTSCVGDTGILIYRRGDAERKLVRKKRRATPGEGGVERNKDKQCW